MNFNNMCSQTKFFFKRHGGLVCTVVAAVTEAVAIGLAIKQTRTVDKVLEPAGLKIQELKDNDASKKELNKERAKTGLKLARHYALPLVAFAVSEACIFGSHRIMYKKQVALSSALLATQKAYAAYRERVKEQLGEEIEKDIHRNVKKECKLDEDIRRSDMETNEYSIMFDAASFVWEKNGRANFETLVNIQNQLNIDLKRQGYLFLIDVYKALHIPLNTIDTTKLQAAYVVGWIYDPYDDTRDSYIDFGISTVTGSPINDGIYLFNNTEKDCWLDFNVDGDILTGAYDKKTGKNKRTFTEVVKG